MPTRKTRIRHDRIVQGFAERLRGVRQARGMTQRDLAHHAHVTVSHLSKLEAGGAAPGIDLVQRLAEAMRSGRYRTSSGPGAGNLESSRQQVKDLFEAVLAKSGQETLTMVNLFLTRLLESRSINR